MAEGALHDGLQGHQGDGPTDLQMWVPADEILPFVLWWEQGALIILYTLQRPVLTGPGSLSLSLNFQMSFSCVLRAEKDLRTGDVQR